MTHKEPLPGSGNNDDKYLKETLDGILSSSPDLQAQVDSLNETEEYRHLAANEAVIVHYLADKIPAIEKLSQILESLQQDQDNPTMIDVVQAVHEITNELSEKGTPPETLAPFNHMRDLAGTISDIAANHDAIVGEKEEIQIRILERSHLSPEEKQALIEASDHFIAGSSLDVTDPDAVANALVQSEHKREEEDANMALGRKAGILFNRLIANKYGIDPESDTCSALRILVRAAATTGYTAILGNVDDMLAELNIPKGEFYDTVDHIIQLVNYDAQ